MSEDQIFRLESKIPLGQFEYCELDSVLLGMGIYPVKKHDNRTVNSVYFDTFDYKDYFENISGISVRQKVRLRWYDNDNQNLRFEVKKKNNKVSEKIVYSILNDHNIPIQDDMNFNAVLPKIITDVPLGLISHRQPVLSVRYERDYFEIEPGLRMTIDKNIAYRALYPHNEQCWFDSPVYAVIELKSPLALKGRVSSILKDFPYRLFRHSKYVIGIDTIYSG